MFKGKDTKLVGYKIIVRIANLNFNNITHFTSFISSWLYSTHVSRTVVYASIVSHFWCWWTKRCFQFFFTVAVHGAHDWQFPMHGGWGLQPWQCSSGPPSSPSNRVEGWILCASPICRMSRSRRLLTHEWGEAVINGGILFGLSASCYFGRSRDHKSPVQNSTGDVIIFLWIHHGH